MSNTLWVFLGIFLVIAGIAIFEHHEVHSEQLALDTAKAQFQVCSQANADLKSSIDSQNASIKALKKKSDDEKAASTQAIQKALAASAILGQRVTYLNSIKLTGNECKDTFKYIDAYFGGQTQ